MWASIIILVNVCHIGQTYGNEIVKKAVSDRRRLLATSYIHTCVLYCIDSVSELLQLQFCQFFAEKKRKETISLLDTNGQRDIIGVRKWPLSNDLCQLMCNDLPWCPSFGFNTDTNVCLVGKLHLSVKRSTSPKVGTFTSKTNSPSKLATKTLVTIKTSDTISGRTNPNSPISQSSTPLPFNTTSSDVTNKTLSVRSLQSDLTLPVSSKEHTALDTTHIYGVSTTTIDMNLPCVERCKKPNATCFQEKCVCKPGFVKQPPEDQCLKDCQLFSDNFTVQATEQCSEKYHKKHPHTGEAECRLKCIAIGNKFCTAFQLERGNCYTLTRWNEWPVVHWKNSKGCKYYQRNCDEVDNKPCNNCNAIDRRCDNGQCVCAMGFSLVTGTDKCVSECSLSDIKVSLQSRRICIDKYIAQFVGVDTLTCQKKCMAFRRRECRAYQLFNGDCYILSQNSITSKDPWEDWSKCDHYQRNCRSCDDQCVEPNYVCRQGQCMCNLGYIPTTDGKCVMECDSYTIEFSMLTAHPFMCLKQHDKKYSYPRKSSEDCASICLRQPFVCWGYELINGTCYVLKVTPGLKLTTNWKSSPQCQHFTRRCNFDGERCREPCEEPNYTCVKGKCVCGIGYRQTTDKKCVKVCRSYSKEFSLQAATTCGNLYWEKYTRKSEDECRRACLESKVTCNAFESYDGECFVIRQSNGIQMWGQYTGCEHFARNCDHKGTECDRCDPPNYRCRDNKCQCSRGYIRAKRTERCVKECSSYAYTFTHQSTHHCLHEYKKRIMSTSTNKCKSYCIRERQFMCAAFHVYNGNCYLMAWTDRLTTAWETHIDCKHYMRDCNPSCEIGLSLVRKKNVCVPKCKEYSQEFVQLSSSMCMDKYKRKKDHTGRTTCQRLCISATDFLCDSIEIYEGTCYLISTDKTTNHPKWKEYKECSHYQRTCIS